MTEETNPTPDLGNDQTSGEKTKTTTDFSTRLQNQSAILGKVVNQSNTFAKDLNEIKSTVTEMMEANKRASKEERKQRKKEASKSEKQQASSDAKEARNTKA